MSARGGSGRERPRVGEAVLWGTENGERFSDHFVFADVFEWRDGRWQVIYIQVTRLPPVP